MRFKNRYMLLRLIWRDEMKDETLNEGFLLQHFRDAILSSWGDWRLGCSLSSVQVKFYCPFTGLCIVRCGRDELKEVLSSISLITSIANQRLFITQLHISGSIRNCRELALEHHVMLPEHLQSKISQQIKVAIIGSRERLQAVEL